MPYLAKITKRLAMSVALAVAAAACTDGAADMSTAPSVKQDASAELHTWRTRVARTVVSPEVATLEIADTLALTARAYNSRDSLLTGRTVYWSSRAPSVATVDATGRVVARQAGVAWIRGTIDSRSDSTRVTVTAPVVVPASEPGLVTDLRLTTATSGSLTIAFTEVNDGTGAPANYSLIVGSPTVTFTGNVSAGTEIVGSQVGATRSYTIAGLAPSTMYQVLVVSLRGRLGALPVVGPPSAILIASTTAIATGVTPFFADGFDTGARLNANGFSWSTANGGVSVSSERAFSGTHSLRFRFEADVLGDDSWAEQRFNLGRNLTEIWIDMMIYVPANYRHRNDSPSNNKFIRIWGDDYAAENKVGASTWFSSSSPTTSSMRIDRFTTPSGMGPSSGPDGVTSPTAAYAVTKGAWNRVRLHFRHTTSFLDNNALAEVWFGATKVLSWSDMNQVFDSARPYWNAGYLLGWSNSGFDEETIFFIDDVKFYSTNPGW